MSPEYFTQFKFHQFRIENVPDRFGAAIVGWNAAWWMGIVIGIILIPAGLFIRGSSNYFWGMIRVFGVVTVTTLFAGLVALLIAYLTLNSNGVGEVTRYSNEIADDLAFTRAGTMHNFSYLGGMIGIITGGLRIYYDRCKHTSRTRSLTKTSVNSMARTSSPIFLGTLEAAAG